MRCWPICIVVLAACQQPPPPSSDEDSAPERAQLVQCCQGLVHEAWNSDPPNAQVLHAARACERLAREGKLNEARERLSAAGHATECNNCPINGCHAPP